MRRMFTVDEAEAAGLTEDALRWGAARGRWRLLDTKVYGVGSGPPTPIEAAVATAIAIDGVAGGTFAAAIYSMDGVRFDGPDISVPPSRSGRRAGIRRRRLTEDQVTVVDRLRVTTPLQTLLDLAADVDDLVWEQALEWVLRHRHATVADVEAGAEAMGRARQPGVSRIRRVLALRPPGAPPTGSLLETLMVQLIRSRPDLPTPRRQVDVFTADGVFVARVDLAWPDLGAFAELDGQQHKDQPVYDASRETAVVAASGWLCGRFTWHEVTRTPRYTARKLEAVLDQARRRPMTG